MSSRSFPQVSCSHDRILAYGLGVAFGDFRRAFTIDLRYQHGLSTVQEAGGFTTHHRVVLLMAGYEL